MPETDVETILREIRDQVYAEQALSTTPVVQTPVQPQGPNGDHLSSATEEVDRISAQLSTLARAWDRLPPVISNRQGSLARFELWIKQRAKSAFRWFTWEQVNFNAATHQALKDIVGALTKLGGRLERLENDHQGQQQELTNQTRELEKLASRLQKQASDLATQGTLLGQQKSLIQDHEARLDQLLGEMNAHRAERVEQRQNDDARLAEFAAEVRQVSDRTIEEQRVCFKQLSLEANEASLVLDRIRRELQSRLEKLENKTRKAQHS